MLYIMLNPILMSELYKNYIVSKFRP